MSTNAERIIELPVLSMRASVANTSEANREIEVRFATATPVTRQDYTGVTFDEVLSMDPKHVRLDRLNSGAPLLGSHRQGSLSDVLGVVVDGSARVDLASGARARVRFSKRPDVEPFYQDVRDGIIRSVSVGYRVYRYQEETKVSGSGRPTWVAIDWEPFEISLVSIPADPKSGVGRSADTAVTRCVIVTSVDVAREEWAQTVKKVTLDERERYYREDYPLLPFGRRHSAAEIAEMRRAWERNWPAEVAASKPIQGLLSAR